LQNLGCRPIQAVPYAMSLMPGARVVSTANWGAVLTLENQNVATALQAQSAYGTGVSATGQAAGVSGATTGSSVDSAGVKGTASSGAAYGGYFTSTKGTGLYGSTDAGSEGTAGVYGLATRAGSRGVMGVNTAGWDGVYGWSDAGTGVVGATFKGNIFTGWAGEPLELRFGVSSVGDVSYSGALVGAFPRPAYDTGWVSVNAGSYFVRNFTLSASTDDLVVDLTCSGGGGQNYNNNLCNTEKGVWYTLEQPSGPQTLLVMRGSANTDCFNVRARVWVVK
jgi:hypothetical protein